MNDIREEISRLPAAPRGLIEELLVRIQKKEAVELSSIAREIIGLPSEQRDLVKSVLLRVMQTDRRSDGPPPLVSLPRKQGINTFPLSFAQQRLWLLDQLAPGSPAYNQSYGVSLKGPISVAKLQTAINKLVQRHESLRTTFSVVDGQPVQVISPPQPLNLTLKDLRAIPEEQREAEARRLVLEQGRKSFDLKNGPLMRVLLLRLSEQEHVLVLTLHHIVFDGWSLIVLVREIAQFYVALSHGRPTPLPEPTLQYADFAVWQRNWLTGDVLQSHLAYWREKLGGELPLLELPSYRPRPAVQSFAGAIHTYRISPELTRALRQLSVQEDVTLYMTFLAAFNVLLFRFTGQEDLIVGSPIAGQSRSELEDLIGFFVNTLALRTDLSGNPSFKELMARVREVCLGAYAHQEIPFEKIVEELNPERNLERTSIFQAMLVLFNTRRHSIQLSNVSMEVVDIDLRTAKFDLSLYLYEGQDELTGFIEYNTDILDEAAVTRIAESFTMLLENIVANPDQRISRIPMMTDREHQQAVVDWNLTHHDYRSDTCIHNLFEEQVRATPDATAVIFGQGQLTFAELNHRANQLARFLQKLDIGLETRVGICMERSASMIIGLLGILKAGGCYVPLDPSYPEDRLAFMIEDAQSSLLLTEESLASKINTSERVLLLDTEWDAISAESGANCSAVVSPLNSVYIIYTSGSTGTPKGVVGLHQAAINRLSWMWETYPFTAGDVCCQKTPLSFVDSVWEIFGPLLRGIPLVIIPDDIVKDLPRLIDALAENEVTRIAMVPSLLRVILETQSDLLQRLGKLKHWVCSGEALPLDLAQRFRSELPDALLINLYGSTEDSADVTYHEVSGDHSLVAVPIGRPISNTRAYILDHDMQPVPTGVSAELYVAGDGLARGYFNGAAQTAERFLPDPFASDGGRLYRTGDFARYQPDGTIQYMGRRDHQIKIRGKRVELAEVEAVLRKHSEVRRCAVVAKQNRDGEQQLVAYVVPQTSSTSRRANSVGGVLQTEQITQWQTVWDQTYRETPVNQDPTFNIIGWNSSFTGLPISEPEMREWVESTVAGILSLSPRRVLEIGCGSGLLTFRIAPECDAYVGTDISETSLDQLRRAVSKRLPQLPASALLYKEADDFEGLNGFDGIILNSVIQYFPGVEYLVRVLEKAVNALDENGWIYIGDVRSKPLLEAAVTSVELSRAQSSLPLDEFRQRVQKRMNEEEELVIDPAFFFALKKHLPRISRVEVTPKRGRYYNELNQFRYQVVLHVNAKEAETAEFDWHDWQNERINFVDLRERLIAEKPEVVAFTDVANARLEKEVLTIEALAQMDGNMTAGELRRVTSDDNAGSGIDPEDLWQLSNELPYSAQLSWMRHNRDGRLDFILRRREPAGSEMLAPLFPAFDVDHKSWSEYANDPVGARYTGMLAQELRATLKEKLPEFMLPSYFIMLEDLPLTPSGKLNRRALPEPESSRPELAERYVAPRTEVEQVLAGIWSELLRVERVGIYDNFFKLGGHSLLITRILLKVQALLNVDLPMRVLLESPTIAGMAQAIELVRSGVAFEPLRVVDLKAEAVLDDDIYPGAAAAAAASVPEKILLTGATGFLGTFLLHELLQQTKAKIFCLIRAKDREDASRKLKAALEDKLLWDQSQSSRIEPVVGDLSEPLLGLSRGRFDELSKEIGLIYHNGAVVNFSYPYSELKRANVLGTREILKLACLERVKPVQFVSTVGVFSARDAQEHPLTEDVEPEHYEYLTTGYAQSKWVAERLVKIAGSRGLPVSIYRPGLITGDSRTGVSNLNDFASLYIKGCIHLGHVPEADEDLNGVPVDYVSRAIVRLSLKKESIGKTFHLVNPQPLDARLIGQWFTSLNFGIQEIPYSQWRTALEASPDNPLYTLLPSMPEWQDEERMMIQGRIADRVRMKYESRNTLEILGAMGVTCPPVDSKLLNTYLSYFVDSGFLSQS